MATPEQPDPTTVALGPTAKVLRRRLGPVAWAVLECLIETARDDRGAAVSEHSVRGLAEALGLSKNTAARALQRLAVERLVERVANRDVSGRFGTGAYRLDLPPGVIAAASPAPAARRPSRPRQDRPRPASSSGRSPRRTSRPSTVTQLSLIDLDLDAP